MGLKEIASNGFRYLLFEQDGIAQHLFGGQPWEPHFLLLADVFVAPGSIVCDAGANFGYHTLHLSRLVGSQGKVLAFEPQRIIFQQLCFHLFLNFIGNVTAYPSALGSKRGSALIGELHEINAGNIGATSLGRGSCAVEVVPLDQYGEMKFSFIKIDVQGSEKAFLEGACKTIERDKPLLFIEIEENWLRDLGSSSKEVIEHIFAMDYSLLRIESDWPTDHLCFPKEKRDEVLKKLETYPWKLTLLEGKTIELKFGQAPYYESFFITS